MKMTSGAETVQKLRWPTGARSSVLTKWALFGVALPLLPILSKVCAEWMDLGRVDLSSANLFGDGELLVIATVIAAAGIGDLVFDLRRTKRPRSYRDSIAIALALFCVIFSVLLYALVTLKREQLTPQQRQVSTSVVAQKGQVTILQNRATNLHAQLAAAQTRFAEASLAAQREFNGTGGTRTRGAGLEYRRLVQVANNFEAQSNEARVASIAADRQLAAAQSTLTTSQLNQVKALASVDRHPYNENRGARASIWMFALSLLAGFNCVLAGSRRRKPRPQPVDRGEPASITPAAKAASLNGHVEVDSAARKPASSKSAV